MYKRQGKDSVTPLTDDPNWGNAGLLKVFEGEATDESDKLKLMLPVLGLYATLFASVVQERERVKEAARRLARRSRRLIQGWHG